MVDEPLLVARDAFLPLYLVLDGNDGVTRLDNQGNRLDPVWHFHENLHIFAIALIIIVGNAFK